ncbi:23S rRNA (pseudouridine1915-N3)-methyltransferase [Marinirhabdus gelatinilytica]|uniref:Ribosomal RNA large subunit methyltransferase H n=2 Tax=Marinirhabdus gelatinilytica TaxID=1703343 RepID=A0A370QFQ8_9FLAO|nr:23S rRNA (pseudouridine1915-N3)-methyltransferase [Marinirhabdus gelatinilytica]
MKYSKVQNHYFCTMKITLLAIGKTDDKNLQKLIDVYQKRLSHYVPFTLEVIPDIKKTKNLSEEQQKQLEGNEILKRTSTTDHLILLDEKGVSYSSIKFANFLQKKMNSGLKNLVFVIGGPYGFSQEIYDRAQGKVSLSAMTFSHQMVRLFVVEQLYRGFTILRNEPYHHR